MESIVREALFVFNNNLTVREAGKELGISKSVLHRHLSNDLKKWDHELYLKVKKMFSEHNKIRHINGGLATKNKYLKMGEENEADDTFLS